MQITFHKIPNVNLSLGPDCSEREIYFAISYYVLGLGAGGEGTINLQAT